MPCPVRALSARRYTWPRQDNMQEVDKIHAEAVVEKARKSNVRRRRMRILVGDKTSRGGIGNDEESARIDYRIPESRSAFCRIVSFTAANTNRMLLVSVACVK